MKNSNFIRLSQDKTRQDKTRQDLNQGLASYFSPF
jgi:hypothetical protein